MSRVAVIGIVGNSVFLPVDHFHVGGETVEAYSAYFEPGGKGFNAAVAAKRYGADVFFLAAIGNEGAEGIERFLENESIEGALIKKDGGTAFASIVTDKSGRNHVTVYQGAQLTPCDVERFESQIAASDLLLLNNEVSEEVNVKAIELGVKHNIPIILNPAPARPLSPFVLENVTLFTPNEHEQAGLDGKKNVVVTLGKDGCYIRAFDLSVPAVNVATVVDTTGAGDTFNGVLAATLAEGYPLLDAVKIANLASSIEVTRKGAVYSIPTRAEIQANSNKLS